MASESLLYFALAAIALGNGLFLPSLPSQIDDLYAKDDPRRGSAYNFYYVGINVGGLLAPLVCGTLGELYGWHWGFGAAGIGMLLRPCDLHARCALVAAGATEASATWRPAERMPRDAMRKRVLALLAIGLCVMVFRGAYEQSGNTIALWADVGLDRQRPGGFTIPMTWFQALNPLLVIFLTPLLVMRWTKQASGGREPSPAKKMAMGAFVVASAFVMLALRRCERGRARALDLARVRSSSCSPSASFSSCRSASACSRASRRRGTPRPRSPPGTSPLSAETCWPARWAPCGARWGTRPSSA